MRGGGRPAGRGAQATRGPPGSPRGRGASLLPDTADGGPRALQGAGGGPGDAGAAAPLLETPPLPSGKASEATVSPWRKDQGGLLIPWSRT